MSDEQRDRWMWLFNRLDAAVEAHREKSTGLFADEHDAALWRAHAELRKDAAAKASAPGESNIDRHYRLDGKGGNK